MKHLILFLLLAPAVGVISLGASDTTRPTPAGTTGPGEDRPDNQILASDAFLGEWRPVAYSSQVVEQAVRRGTATLGFFSRGFTRWRLVRRLEPPEWIRCEREGDSLVVEVEGRSARRFPLSDPIPDLPFEPTGATRRLIVTDRGRRQNVLSLTDGERTLTVDTTVTDPGLPAPLRFTLTFVRSR